MLALLFQLPPAWITQSQSILGAQVEEIRDQFAGVPLAADRNIYSTLGFLWSFPELSNDTRGLGGGITYAWDPELCGQLEPTFRENEDMAHINCADIKASVHRAFGAWASNSRFIKFNDVTHECEALGYMDANTTERGFAPAVAAGLDSHDGCPLAEIWITPMQRADSAAAEDSSAVSTGRRSRRRRLASSSSSSFSSSSAGRRLAEDGVAVATAESYYTLRDDFRYTNGVGARTRNGANETVPRQVVETYAGTLYIGVDGADGETLCWYLDSEFCSFFHNMKQDLGDPETAKAMSAPPAGARPLSAGRSAPTSLEPLSTGRSAQTSVPAAARPPTSAPLTHIVCRGAVCLLIGFVMLFNLLHCATERQEFWMALLYGQVLLPLPFGRLPSGAAPRTCLVSGGRLDRCCCSAEYLEAWPRPLRWRPLRLRLPQLTRRRAFLAWLPAALDGREGGHGRGGGRRGRGGEGRPDGRGARARNTDAAAVDHEEDAAAPRHASTHDRRGPSTRRRRG